jgi:hypothetical protein
MTSEETRQEAAQWLQLPPPNGIIMVDNDASLQLAKKVLLHHDTDVVGNYTPASHCCTLFAGTIMMLMALVN